jgi:RNA polymerase sigma factor (TIGR02999 family)
MSLDASQILADVQAGKRPPDELYPVLYDELRRAAGRLMGGERSDHTLQATLLANDAFLRLIGGNPADWNSPRHFVALAARAMRRILIDHARARNRIKRGKGRDQAPLDSALESLERSSGWADLEALDGALARLAEIQPRAAQVVQLRFFADLKMETIAAALDCALPTVERDWRYARAWLRSQLTDGNERGHAPRPD